MSSLIALKNQLNKTSSSLSLREKALAIREAGKSNILLLDTSASMDTPTRDYNALERQTRIDVLWNVVQRLRSDGLMFKVCEFNSYAQWSDGVSKPTPDGGTELADAFDFIASATPKQVTIITDGEPSWGSESSAIARAKQLNCRVNVVFVGNESNDRAVAFCKALADACNGQYAYNSLASEQLQIAAQAQVRLLLTAGSSETERSKTINL